MKKEILKNMMVLILMMVSVGLVQAASAQSDAVEEARIRIVKKQFEKEPSAQDTIRKALEYFRVNPSRIEDLRSRARSRGWAPMIAAGYRYDREGLDSFTERRLSQNLEEDSTSLNEIHSVTAGAIWDFRDAVFHPSEVSAYGLISTQRDIMLDVIRTYYMRRQLILRSVVRKPKDAFARVSIEIRIAEYTALLDSLTDGWFSTGSKRRSRTED